MQQCSGNIDSSPLTSGESAHSAFQQILKFQKPRKFGQTLFESISADTIQRCPALQIIPYRQFLIQNRILEYDTQTAFDSVRIFVKISTANVYTARVFGQLTADSGRILKLAGIG